MLKSCEICSKEFQAKLAEVKRGWGKFCSRQCRGKWHSINHSQENHTGWKGNKVKYSGLHMWLRRHYGNASQHSCAKADKTCKGKKNWSNISRKYKRDIADWWVLCQSHHIKYDMTDEWLKKIRKNALKKRIKRR